MSKPDVLVIPKSAWPHVGFRKGGHAELAKVVAASGYLMPRVAAEEDASVLQVCTYGLVEKQGRLLTYERPKDHSRPELASLWSIGIGGHVERGDIETFGPRGGKHHGAVEAILLVAALRETDEEIGPSVIGHDAQPLGVLFLPGGAGDYHIGYVTRTRVHRLFSPLFSGELIAPAFVDPVDIFEDRLEPWSREVLHACVATPADLKNLRAERERSVGAMIDNYCRDRAADAAKSAERAEAMRLKLTQSTAALAS